AEICIR
ncbi:unnamed protein product, partial [Allacma fusca]